MLLQFFGSEKITKLQKDSNTVVTLPAGSKIKLGGKGSQLKVPLSLNTAVLGAGGMESAIAASTFYYVYVVLDAGVEKLIAATSVIKPLNFNSYKKVGAFYTNGSSQIANAFWQGEINKILMTAEITSAAAITRSNWNWIDAAIITLTGRYAVQYTSLNLAVPPVPIGALSIATPAGQTHTKGVPTTTSVLINIATTAGTEVNDDFSVGLSKAGIDAVQPDWNNY